MAGLLVAVFSMFLGSCAAESDDDGSSAPQPSDLTGSYVTRIEERSFYAGFPELRGAGFGGSWSLELSEVTMTYVISHQKVGEVSDGRFGTTEAELKLAEYPSPKGTFNCARDGERLVDYTTATYSWSLDSGALTLQAVDDPCPLRKFILQRTWELKPS